MKRANLTIAELNRVLTERYNIRLSVAEQRGIYKFLNLAKWDLSEMVVVMREIFAKRRWKGQI